MPVFFPVIFAISLAMVKNDVKNVIWRVFLFPELATFFFFFFFVNLCHLSATCYSWVLFLKQKVVHSVLSFDWSVCRVKVTCWWFCNTFEFLQMETAPCDFMLSLQSLELVQTKNGMSSHSVRFPLRYWTWVEKYKENYFDWKITKKVLKLTKLTAQISKCRPIYEKSKKISIFISSFLRVFYL